MIRQLLFLYLLVTVSSVLAGDKVINVTVKTVNQAAYYPQGSAPATAMSLNDAMLSAHIQSSITDISVQVADTVNKDDVLVQLDCRHATATKQSNQAKMSLAEFQLQRAKKLRKGNNISEEVLRTRQSELAIARSALKVSEIEVERCQVRAPFRGVVRQRVVDIGEWVTMGEPLIQLVDLDHVEVSAQLPDLSINELKDIQQFYFVAGNARFSLQRRAISEVVDNPSRTREARFVFTDKRAQPGQSGRLIWQLGHRYLPSRYLVKRNEVNGIFVVENGHARFIAMPDTQEGRPIQINLAKDVQVIDKGRYSVKDDVPVKIIH
jgi:RND family efflux transporter MFP subunit